MRAWPPLLASPWPLQFLLCAAALLLLLGTPLQAAESRFYDACLRWRADMKRSPAVDSHVVHMDIDEHQLEQWPDTVDEYAGVGRIVSTMLRLGARVVALDLIFHRGTPADFQPLLAELKPAEAIVLGMTAGHAGRSFPGVRPRPELPSGALNLTQDRDGVYRKYVLARELDLEDGRGSRLVPSLALAVYLASRRLPWSAVKLERGRLEWSELGADGSPRARVVPCEIWLDFRQSWQVEAPGNFLHHGPDDLKKYQKEGNSPLEGGLVFVAYTAPGFEDQGPIPLGPVAPRVLLHSTALNDLLQNTWRTPAPAWLNLLSVLSLLGVAWVGQKRLLIAWLVGCAAAALGGGALIFSSHWVPYTVTTVVLYTASFLMESARRYLHEVVERARLHTVMSYYFSPRVLDRVLATPGALEAQQVEVVLLLTDLRNFTALSERLPPATVFALVNRVFEVQTEAVMAEDGSLEHFLGDQFLSYWGAPGVQPQAADQALRAAEALMAGMERLLPSVPPDVAILFGYGLALHAGPALIGNKGSARRLDYGLMGDTVNTAARVESLTKLYRVPFLITRQVYDKLTAPPPCRTVDVVLPVGKQQPLELLDVRHALSPSHFEQLAEGYRVALDLYRHGQFTDAEARMRRLAEEFGDGPSQLLAERCALLAQEAPTDWDGIYRFTSKSPT